MVADPLGDDLRELAREHLPPIVSVAIVSTLVSADWGNIGYRIETADGRVWKGRRFESAAVAGQSVRFGRALPSRWAPALVAYRGASAIYEWVDGAPLSSTAVDASMLRSAGAFLREVHEAVLPEPVGEDSWLQSYPGFDWRGALLERIEVLRSGGRLSAPECALAVELATRFLPPPQPTGLVHGDLCPENIVVSNGRLRIVDNDGLAVHVPQFDLARTWSRWSMTEVERAAFNDGYGHRATIDAFDACFPHWTVVVLVGAAQFRLRHRLPGVDVPIARLREVFSQWAP